ncbi:unnamed protein product [Peronospora belbahrii]|uniref:Uncharacterized protein n=1 Tax=Peronospora belbahrii TaxID=622444 RepID=A0AAU9L957_9STRA|nr:unnamed protein product [Peronospora belbahrii]
MSSQDVQQSHAIKRKDVCIPLVMWNEPPQVEVSTLHVLLLPVSQPSQNSSCFLAKQDDKKMTIEVDDYMEICTEMCVFAGTVDGAILFWRFEQDTVAQVNILVFPRTEGAGEPVVGIVSGTDEWGQSMLISATRDGALARWQLPNGACAEANASLAKELAPLLGLEMLCNKRFTVVVSEESRLMVLDTWRMQLLYCMDTAQEQIRRSIAVGELPMSRPKSLRPRVARVTSGLDREPSYGSESVNQANISPSARERMSPSPSSLASNAPDTNSLADFIASSAAAKQQTQHWDAVVLSLGTKGLVKCYLWQQPRRSSSGTSFNVAKGDGSASTAWGPCWVHRSSWVISWADQAEDITCSQSTSLKDGDNMNPQTALMGSIDNSYFPLSVKISRDSSLVLLIWRTKFVVLKRKWLCPLESRGDSQAKSESFRTLRPTTGIGSCRITPAAFVSQAASTYGSIHPTLYNASDNCGSIYWENGEFLEDGNIVLWTNTGHVFQFISPETSGNPGGKFFIFTKDKDQLVPRSDSKSLCVIAKAMYITSTDRCKCCNRLVHKGKYLHPKPRRAMGYLTGQRQDAGYTCVNTSSLLSGLQIVHMCHHGTLGHWTMPASPMSSSTRISQNKKSSIIAASAPLVERVRFHSLSDGFEATEEATQDESTDKGTQDEPRLRCCLTHFIIGREETRLSSTFEVVRRAGMRRNRRQGLGDVSVNIRGSELSSTGTSAVAIASRLATALTGRGRPPGVGDESCQLEADGSKQMKSEHLDYWYLLDIPIIAKGFTDGMLHIELLSQDHLSSTAQVSAKDTAIQLSCHSGRVTALAHCCWEVRAASISSCGVASPTSASQVHFATEKNPFYQSRFRNPLSKRKSKDGLTNTNTSNHTCRRSLTIETSGSSEPNNGSSWDKQPSITFMLFSGGTDGILLVIELILYRSATTNDEANGFVRQKAKMLQKFRNHRGAIQQISISPLKNGSVDGPDGDNLDTKYPDRLVATLGVDHKVVIYAPQYSRHSSSRQPSVCNTQERRRDDRYSVEWRSVLELSEHADSICSLVWHLERGLVHIECNDRMVYVWSTDTGILERKVPYALIYGGGHNVSGESASDGANGIGCSVVENFTLYIGNTAVQVIEFGALRSAEQLKKNWLSYYISQFQSSDAVVNGFETKFQSSRASIYATGSMELFMLSLLLSWGVTPAIDQSCHAILGIKPVHALYSCALQDYTSGALTIPVPWSMPKVLPLPIGHSSVAVASKPNNLVMPVVPAFARNWQHSSALSASIALGVLSFCMSCMEFSHPKAGNGIMSPANREEFQVLWSQLITQHSVVLPECVAQFREPALEELAVFGFDSCEYTQLAARTLLSGVIKRLPAAERIILSAEYSAKLHWEIVRLETELGTSFLGKVSAGGNSGGAASSSQASSNNVTRGSSNSASAGSDIETTAFTLVVERLGSLVLLTGMIGTYFPGEISPAGAREVCDILVFLLKAPERFVASVAAELLTKGLMLFRPHLVDLSSLIIQLLMINLREKQRSAQTKESEEVLCGPGGSLANFYDGGTGGSNAAMNLLVEIGAYESAFVLGLLQQEMHNHDRPPGFHKIILLFVMELVNTHYLLMCRHLPAFVDTVMVCLDPTKPERRRRCLSLSTRCLHSLVQRFPMVDFHKDTQRLALGTMEAVIVIYDLRTATKWRVLDGHMSAVSAVRFRSDGHVLVSYAARDGSVRWWNSGNAGLFGGMLKMHQSCLKEHKLAALTESSNGGAPVSTGGASAGLKQIIQTCRFHFLIRKDNSHDGRSNTNQSKCILRLTREDASQVQFLL